LTNGSLDDRIDDAIASYHKWDMDSIFFLIWS
jgi:hypothetical protein